MKPHALDYDAFVNLARSAHQPTEGEKVRLEAALCEALGIESEWDESGVIDVVGERTGKLRAKRA